MNTAGATAAGYFGAMVDSYDSLIRRAVPCYDVMVQRAIEYAPSAAGLINILELGCGTGNLTLTLLERYAGAHVTAVDAAPEMTAAATERARAKGAGSRLHTVTARFEDLRRAHPEWAGRFGLVTSCMSLHHVIDKQALYHDIAAWLAPGGTLIFADQFAGATDALHQVNWRAWIDFCKLPGHCTPDELQGLVDHSRAHDHYVPVADHFDMFRRAGFVAPDCAWRNGMYGVLVCVKAG